MALFHKLGNDAAIVHLDCPSGKNSAKHLWKDVFLGAAVSGSTALKSGMLPGCISDAELAKVTAGDVLEIAVVVPGELEKKELVRFAKKSANDRLEAIQRDLAWFGLTVEDN